MFGVFMILRFIGLLVASAFFAFWTIIGFCEGASLHLVGIRAITTAVLSAIGIWCFANTPADQRMMEEIYDLAKNGGLKTKMAISDDVADGYVSLYEWSHIKDVAESETADEYVKEHKVKHIKMHC